MRHRPLLIGPALALLLVVAADPAHGNGMAMIGVLFLWGILLFGIGLPLLVAVIEALVYRFAVGLRWWRAFGTAVTATAVSTVVLLCSGIGVTYELGMDTDRPGDRLALGLVGLALVLALKLPIIAAMNGQFEQRRKLVITAAIVNAFLCLLGLMTLLVLTG